MLRSARTAGVVMAALAVLATASCSHHGPATVNASTAAQTVASVYKLDRGQQQCLATAFARRPAATRPLASDKPVSDADLAALGDVARGCIPVSTLADAIVGGASQGVTLPDSQQSCLRSAVAALDAGDRATLLAGLAVPSALSDLQTALLGKVTDGLLNTCKVSIPGVTTQDTGTAGTG
jgi:hypothetical protein